MDIFVFLLKWFNFSNGENENSFFSRKRSALYAIFDGHSGARAAEFCRDKLPDVLKKKLSSCKYKEKSECIIQVILLLKASSYFLSSCHCQAI